MTKDYLYLVRYDLDTQNDNIKLIKENEVKKTVEYLRFIKATNIKIYQVDFENELIGKVYEDD